MTTNMMKKGLLNLTTEEFEEILISEGIPKYRSKQIYFWIYKLGKSSFFEMVNLDKKLQEKLDSLFYIYVPNIINIQKSVDGTMKFLLELSDKNTIETVYIPTAVQRNTLCVSSQIGCAMGCKFCNTGYNGFIRNLTAEEIISQYLLINEYVGRNITNIVFMGMGEPLYNTKNVICAIEAFIQTLSRRKITLSTSGITPALKEISPNLKCKLAISLHAPNDQIRNQIMPINKVYNINSIMEAVKIYNQNHSYLKVTFEYLLLRGINDSKKSAYELVELVKGLNARVNILQYNEWKGSTFRKSSRFALHNFVKILEKNNIEAPIRNSRGKDIMAACGQLKSAQGIKSSFHNS